MHPSVGPWGEACRLYVEQPGLAERLTVPGPPLRIYDVGLGAAANAAAAMACAHGLGSARRRPLEVVSFEVDLAPLRLALSDPQGFPFLVPYHEAAGQLMRQGHWERDGVTWTLREGDFTRNLQGTDAPAHLVYFDPFSPKQCPGLWSPATLTPLYAQCETEGEGCLLLTYSAATPTRVSLLLAGFYVGAGVSVGQKGETTVAATRPGVLARPLGPDFLARWRRSSSQAPHGAPWPGALEAALAAHPQIRSPIFGG